MSSILKNKKKKDNYTLSKSDIDFYKMTGVFAIVVIFVLLAINMKSSAVARISSGENLTYNFYMFCRSPLFWALGAVMLVGSVCWFAFCKAKKVDETKRIFTSTNCLAVVAYLAFFSACFGIRENSQNHTFFIAVTIGAAILYYASRFYGMDFVFYSVITALFAMGISLWGMMFDTPYIVAKALVALIGIGLCAYFHFKISKLKLTKQTKASFLKFPMYVSLVLGIIFMFWPGVAFLQNIFYMTRSLMLMVMLLLYIVFAIVYTIKRIRD